MPDPSLSAAAPPARTSEHETLRVLFDLGRQVTSVLEIDELLQKIPEMIGRLIKFQAFAVYFLDAKRGELRIAYSVGYPQEVAATFRLRVGEGLVGAGVAAEQPVLVGEVSADARYVEAVSGVRSELVVPLMHKAKVIGALNLLGGEPNQFTGTDVAILRQFATHVAVALVNARLFERERRDADTFELLAEIGREMASILDLDELLRRVATLMRRVIDYRTFGILLLNESTGELETKLAVKYGERVTVPRVKLGEGLVGYAALHKEPILVSDVTQDPRYIQIVEDVRSELVVPMLLKDRCIGVFNLESPELNAFEKRHVELLTLLASQAAVAIENARLYEAVRANELRLEQEVRFAQRVQMALLPSEAPTRLRGVEVAASFAPARELGGDFYDFLKPESSMLVVAVGDVSGKGVPAALYSAFAAELVRGRTYRRRYLPERSSPGGVLASVNLILHQRQLEEFYCTLCYALFDMKRRFVTLANSGLPYPVRWHAGAAAAIELPGVPLGPFPASTYDELTFPLTAGDVYAFCTDGIYETTDPGGRELGTAGVVTVLNSAHDRSARDIATAVFETALTFRAGMPPADDLTVVVVKITA